LRFRRSAGADADAGHVVASNGLLDMTSGLSLLAA
jgi:hypothetical protein